MSDNIFALFPNTVAFYIWRYSQGDLHGLFSLWEKKTNSETREMFLGEVSDNEVAFWETQNAPVNLIYTNYFGFKKMGQINLIYVHTVD